ncbi:MAG: pantothenate kinase [Aquificaceae bacterium]|jgi:hypothetical protein|uniref:pantothenate kinase n=1 Tax=Hydrogenobacter sp. Uz 6-8 TaxID=3384828 RepID=UPI0030ABE2B8
MKFYSKEDLSYKNIIVSEEGRPPEGIEVTEDLIKVYSSKKVFEIPVASMRGKAILDRLNYQGELTQEIYI